jgi:DNA-binding XRE family transcriptional regulator
MQELAAEAEFQLLAAADVLNWLAALAGAIHVDHVHNRGRDAEHLAQLAQYLSDADSGGVRFAIEQFKELSESAPQNVEVTFRGATGAGKTLAQRVTWARESAGLTQQALATLIKVKQGTISYLEAGKTRRSGSLPDIARACRVDLEWLAFGSEGAQ